ncbi:ABC transporter ATP-binding protein/permease [Actinomyces sp. B33]|uniref:ABC transporter ATP-binding protein/permease n=1 Tax=Actinomyces sp. B33 TaxID=2942131 RepID=UPI00233FD6D0|nr:ABC transporter ATP-binding protein/permease [Actinomyces sp. B33]MDC4233751.1 ABC transporter ATP-binding protein/permease [Actinomyces sp. B33]
MLELKGITKSYTTASLTQTALDDVSVAFRDNEFVAVLGQSGSGKTTMLNVIGGLDHFDSGDLVIDGISTRDYTDRDWDSYRNNRIGFVFQSYNLIPHQSVLANVELALTLSGVSPAERRRRALEALEDVGLGDHVHKRPAQMSGGQMQRVAIARALVNDPEILLADEPTGALDSATSIQVMDLLRDVAADRLVIMVTHNPDLAHRYATRIVELADGRIKDDSAPFAPVPGEARDAKPARRTSMSLATALSLSANNLMTKKGRTVMTAFAGSIGIIGIAAILALANGVNDYIARTEEEALTSYPLSIQRTAMDMTAMMGEAEGQDVDAEQADPGRIGTRTTFTQMAQNASTNDLGALKDYFDNDGGGISSRVAAIEYGYDTTPQIYQVDTGPGIVQVSPDQAFTTMNAAYGAGAFSSFVSMNAFSQMPATAGLYEDKYEVLAGTWPQSDSDLVLVLDSTGRMTDLMEYTLGLRDHGELDDLMKDYYSGAIGRPRADAGAGGDAPQSSDPADEGARPAGGSYSFDEVLGVEFSRINAADRYVYDEAYGVWTDKSSDRAHMSAAIEAGQRLRVVGVVRAVDEDTQIIQPGLAYRPELTRRIMDEATASPIVRSQIAHPDTDVFTGRAFADFDDPSDAGADFDMTQLFTVDESRLQAGFRIDPDKLQLDLSGMDASGLDLSGLDPSAFDMSGADLSALDPSAFDLSGIGDRLDPAALDWSSLDLSGLTDQLPRLADVDYPTIISKALADGAVKEGAGRVLAERAAAIAQGFAQYAADRAAASPDADGDGAPDVDLASVVSDYFAQDSVRAQIDEVLASDEVIDRDRLTANLTAALGEDPALADIAATVGDRASQEIGRQLSAGLSSAVGGALVDALGKQTTTAMSAAMTQMMTAVQQAIASQMESAMGAFASSMASAFAFDEQAMADAFQINTSPEDLSALMATMMSADRPDYDSTLAELGWGDVDEPSTIDIYPTSFEDKDAVKAIIDDYNADKAAQGKDAQTITYTDLVGLLMSSVTRIIDIISWMLIAFVSISLIVSSIMIAIITYISVLERKKEIGILRAIGASKRDVSHVFNAETVIEGLLSGVMGVVITLGLCVVANAVVARALDVHGIAQLPPTAAVVLVVISVALTLLAGVLPSRKAAREDPVEALRSE